MFRRLIMLAFLLLGLASAEGFCAELTANKAYEIIAQDRLASVASTNAIDRLADPSRNDGDKELDALVQTLLKSNDLTLYRAGLLGLTRQATNFKNSARLHANVGLLLNTLGQFQKEPSLVVDLDLCLPQLKGLTEQEFLGFVRLAFAANQDSGFLGSTGGTVIKGACLAYGPDSYFRLKQESATNPGLKANLEKYPVSLLALSNNDLVLYDAWDQIQSAAPKSPEELHGLARIVGRYTAKITARNERGNTRFEALFNSIMNFLEKSVLSASSSIQKGELLDFYFQIATYRVEYSEKAMSIASQAIEGMDKSQQVRVLRRIEQLRKSNLQN